MKFREALNLCKKGEYVKRKGDSWSEYCIQYGKRHDTGEEFWTAGGTCGGPLTEDYKPKREYDDYQIYSGIYQ